MSAEEILNLGGTTESNVRPKLWLMAGFFFTFY